MFSGAKSVSLSTLYLVTKAHQEESRGQIRFQDQWYLAEETVFTPRF